jgi:hypothetical protein
VLYISLLLCSIRVSEILFKYVLLLVYIGMLLLCVYLVNVMIVNCTFLADLVLVTSSNCGCCGRILFISIFVSLFYSAQFSETLFRLMCEVYINHVCWVGVLYF